MLGNIVLVAIERGACITSHGYVKSHNSIYESTQKLHEQYFNLRANLDQGNLDQKNFHQKN